MISLDIIDATRINGLDRVMRSGGGVPTLSRSF